jgi:sialate O-acetylesterase
MLLLSLAMLLPGTASADVRLPAIIAEGMVLQRNAPLRFWGWADDGESVTVEFLGQKKSVIATQGRWEVTLKPVKTAGGPFRLVIAGKNRIEFTDRLVGEVWLLSGQSNMEWPLRGSFQPEDAIAKSANPNIRLFMVRNTRSDDPLNDVAVQQPWGAASPETTAGFSAVGYFFGRALNAKLGVPIGLISADWGGTPAEAWTPEPRLRSEASLTSIIDTYAAATPAYNERLKAWEEAVDKAKREGTNAPGRPNRWRYSELYNAMIAPLIRFPIKGALWYQGESNASRAMPYRELFPAMIDAWRDAWGIKDFPFLLVQLAPFQGSGSDKLEFAELREAQDLATQRLKNVGMAVITDVGEEKDIHPRKKQPVGERLALQARQLAYGEGDLVAVGPTLKKARFEQARAVLTFDHVGSGLVSGAEVEGGKLVGFTVAGDDGVFTAATALIEGKDRVVVSAATVARPRAVRYGFLNFPVVNLWNKEGLPAAPFRTDMPR